MSQSVEEEFTEFVAGRGPALLRAAFALSGDEHGAHDLLQTALAKAFSRWRQIHAAPEQYVRRIMYNAHISAWRKVRRREVPVAAVPDRAAGGEGAGSTVLRLTLREALQSLPPKQRAIIVLRFLEDVSVEETARIVGCRVGTVGSQTSRALAKLRSLVHEIDQEVTR
ncbi:SigE family RNA polymerase sigma factor [Phytohabitans sp. LJ34]|uniref:SigE family RNA polymerase sigma factor n=1 Tax=Phytohabitans sp. LJ34 TaxID=3452217 RepID=UPI003F8A3ECD